MKTGAWSSVRFAVGKQSIPSSSRSKDLKIGIHSFPAQRSILKDSVKNNPVGFLDKEILSSSKCIACPWARHL